MKIIPAKRRQTCLHLVLLVAILFGLKLPIAGAAPRQPHLVVDDADSFPLSPTLAWNGAIYSLTLRTIGEPLSLYSLFNSDPQALVDAGVTGLLARRNGVAINHPAELTEIMDLYAAAVELYHTGPAPEAPLVFAETLRRVIRHPLFMEQRVRAQLRNEQAEIEQLLRLIITQAVADPLAESFVREYQQALLQTNYSRGAFTQALSKAHFHKIPKALVDLQIIEMVIDEPVLLEFAVVLLLARADATQRLGWLEELANSSAVAFNATERAAIQSVHAEFEQIEQDWHTVLGNLIEDGMLPGQVSQSDLMAWLHESYGAAPFWLLWLEPLYATGHEHPTGDSFYDHFRLAHQALELHQSLLTARATLASTAVVDDPYPGEVAQRFHYIGLVTDLAAAAALRSYAYGVEATAQRGWLDVLAPLAWSDADPEEAIGNLRALAEQRSSTVARQPLVHLAAQTAQELALREALPQWSLYTSTKNINQMIVQDEAVWLGTGGGLVHLDRESGERTLYHALNGLPNSRIVQMLEDTHGDLWVATDRGVSRQDADGEWQTIFSWPYAIDKSLTLAADETLWVNMRDRVAYKKPGDDRFIVLTGEEGFHLNRVDYLTIGGDGSVWLYAHREAIRLSPEGEWSTHDGSDLLSDTWVRSSVAAPNGSLWLITEKDLIRLDPTGEWTRFGSRERITFPISRIEFSADGILWLEAASGVHSMDTTGKWTRYRAEGEGSIARIFKHTDDGSLWFRGDGNMRSLTRDGRWLLYEAGIAFPPEAFVHDLTVDSAGAVWFATDQGISHYISPRQWKHYTTADGLPVNRANQVVADPKGGVWLNMGGEIGYLKDGAVSLYLGQGGLPAEHVYTVHSTQDDYLWFATAEGLVHRTPNGVWQSFTEVDGLADRDVRKIVEGPDRSLWFTHRGAVSRIRPDGRWSTYPDKDELRNGSQLAGWTLDADGTAWFLVRTVQGHELRTLYGDETWERNLVNSPPGEILNAPMIRASNGTFLFLTGGGLWRLEPGGYWLADDTVDGVSLSNLDTFLTAPDSSIWITEGSSPGRPVVYNARGQLERISDISVFPLQTTFPQTQIGWGFVEERFGEEESLSLGYLDEHGSIHPVLTFSNEFHLVSNPVLSGDLMSIVGAADTFLTFITDEIRVLFKDGHHVVHAIKNVPVRNWGSAIQSTDGSFWFPVQGGIARLQIDSSWQPLPTPGARFVQNIAVGLDGSLWFATEQGVLRQRPDGEWVSYADQIPGFVTTLTTAIDGSLWAGTLEGLLHRMGLDGRWTTYTAEEGIPTGMISAIVSNQNGAIWVGVDSGGVVRFQNGVWTSYTPDDDRAAISVRDLALDQDGNLWIAGADGLSQLDTKGQWTPVSNEQTGPLNAVIVAANGAVWASTDAGLVRLEPDGRRETYTVAHGLPTTQIAHLARATDGSIWISSEQGLARLWPDGLLSSYDYPQTVHQVVPQVDGSLLVATENGAFRLIPADSRANRSAGRSIERPGVWSRQALPTLPNTDIVRALAVTSSGELWIGSETGTYFLQNGEWRDFSSKDGWKGRFIRAIVPGLDDSIWIATLTEIGQIDEDRLWTSYSEGLDGALIFDAVLDSIGELWLATSDGVSHLDSQKKWSHYDQSDGLPSSPISAITIDSTGKTWVATDVGAGFLNEQGKWTMFTSENGLAGDGVRAIAASQDGSVWFAVYEEQSGEGRGVSRRGVTGEWTTYTTDVGLADNAVTNIVVAHDDSIWFATWENGITRFTPEIGRWFTYRPDDRQPDATITALTAASDGSVWLATSKELSRFAIDSDAESRMDQPGMGIEIATSSQCPALVTEQEVVVNVETGVRLRQDPKMSSPTVIIAQKGTRLIITESEKEHLQYPVIEDTYCWCYVTALDGVVGWTPCTFLEPATGP